MAFKLSTFFEGLIVPLSLTTYSDLLVQLHADVEFFNVPTLPDQIKSAIVILVQSDVDIG